MDKILSIVVPCFNEEKMIPIFFEKISNIELPLKKEYIFIDDGSSDSTLLELQKIVNGTKEQIRYISFSRNFGKEAAIYAGLSESKGDYVVLMDVDLQDPPEMLIDMYAHIEEGTYHCIGARRVTRKGEPFIRSYFARSFYKLINKISDIDIVDGARDFRMMRRQMVDSILEVKEYNRFSKGIFSWVGFNTLYLEYENHERAEGETTWSFWSLFKYSLQGIVAYSDVPLSIASYMGVISFVISILMMIFFMIRTIIFDNPTQGWTSLMVIILGLGGVQLLSLGILGKYVSQTYLETKRRPLYIVKQTERT
ncbi:glycosyltransferase family 2 protein [Marinilactibacillus sp. XAAS-LB27]|uniref:glycosyltransferase family 2 protein n=1 Tax=Marinilactibacillus sp. XAAS-LB27 TaxID=3114538 RepID=UPI002E1927FF|nr:glycosyltransferase family 2 protein [Marinilactibacillus sp. XAAS-LB27]